MSTRTKLALFVAAALLLGAFFWIPGLLHSSSDLPEEAVSPLSKDASSPGLGDLPAGNYPETAESPESTDRTPGTIPRAPDPSEREVGDLPQENRPALVRIRVHAFDNDGPVSGLRVRVRTPDKFLDSIFGATTDPSGEYTLEIRIDEPISIQLVDGDILVGGTTSEQLYAPGKLHEVWLSVETGHLAVRLPQQIELAPGRQALQFIVESDLLSRNSVRSSTVIGGSKPPKSAIVEHTAGGCEFKNLPVGHCSVTATLLEKTPAGALVPTDMRFRGSATVVGGSTVTCELWRN